MYDTSIRNVSRNVSRRIRMLYYEVIGIVTAYLMEYNEKSSSNKFKSSSPITIVTILFCITIVIGTVEQSSALQTMVSNVDIDGNAPNGMAYDPKNKRIYVTNSESNTVSVIDTNTNTVLGNPIRVGMNPKGIAYDPENERMYVTNFGSNTVSIIDTHSNRALGSTISVGTGPVGIVHDPINHRMYTANLDNKSLSIIDTTTNNVLDRQIGLGLSPKEITYDPINKRIYVTNFAEKGKVSVIDTNTNTLVGNSIEIGSVPQDIAYDSDNRRIYVTNYDSNTVSVIDTNATTFKNKSADSDAPYGLAYDSTKKRLYVSSPPNGLINVIDTEANTVLDPIYTGGSPRGIVYDPVNERLYVAKYNASSISVIQMISLNTTIAISTDGYGNVVTNGSTTTSDEITLGFNDTADPSSVGRGYECSLDGSDFVPCSNPQSIVNLQLENRHIFMVRAVDEYGNVEQTPAQFVWLIGKSTQQGANAQHTECTKNILNDGGVSGSRTDDLDKNLLKALTDPISTAGTISFCVGTKDISNSPGSHNTDGIQHFLQSDGAMNNGETGMHTDESSPTATFDPSFRCNTINKMPNSASLGHAEDGLCIPNERDGAQGQIIQELPQISSQQFEQRNNTTVRNIPLALPF